MTIVELAPKPSASDEAKADAAKIIDDLKAILDAGDFAEMVVIVKHINGHWSHHRTSTINTPEMVGRLSITAQDMIDKYLQSS